VKNLTEQIERYMRTLKLGGLSKEWQTVSYKNNEQYITELLEIELKEREINRINRMVKIAGFRVIKTLEDFIWTPVIQIPQGLAHEDMENFTFVDNKENHIFMGAVGTGKIHLATAIAL
jgi:DNA replication protein DnaC